MHYCTKTMKVRKCGTASRTAFGKVALVAAALFTGYAQADTYAKLSGDTFAYYSDAECTQSIEAPATGLAGVTVLFADDAEYQALVPYTNELAAATAVALQNDITLTADADWRAIDFDLNGKVITLMGWDLQVHKPQGTGCITAGNLIKNGGFEERQTEITQWAADWNFANSAWISDGEANNSGVKGAAKNQPYAGNKWAVLGGKGTPITQEFTVPDNNRPCYIRFWYARYYTSKYLNGYVALDIDGEEKAAANCGVAAAQDGEKSGIWTRDFAAGAHTLGLRTTNYVLCDEITISPESHLVFDIPEGETYENTAIVFGSKQDYFFDGLGLKIDKKGKGTLKATLPNANFGNYDVDAGLATITVEEGTVELGNASALGALDKATVEVKDGAVFDMGEATAVSVKHLVLNGTVSRRRDTDTLAATSSISGHGSTPCLALAPGAIFKPDGAGYLTIESSLSGLAKIEITSDVSSSSGRLPLFKVGEGATLPEAVALVLSGPDAALLERCKIVSAAGGRGYDLYWSDFTYAKIVDGEFKYYNDESCEPEYLVATPASGLSGTIVLFASDAEFQALVPFTNELAAAHRVSPQCDITLAADADWRAIDFDLNDRTITLMGHDLHVRKPQGAGRITAGNLIKNGGFEVANASTADFAADWNFTRSKAWALADGNGINGAAKNQPYAGNKWAALGGKGTWITQEFTVPDNQRPCYIRFWYARYFTSGYVDGWVALDIDGKEEASANCAEANAGAKTDVWVKDFAAGTHSLGLRTTNYALCDEITISPESHLVFDIPEGETFENTAIVFGSEQDCFFDGIGLQVHKIGGGHLKMTMPNVKFGGSGATSIVVEEGTISKGTEASCGEQYSCIAVKAGARFDLDGRTFARYDYAIAGSGTDGVGALVNSGAVSNPWATGNSYGYLRNITLDADAMIGGTADFGMIYYGNDEHTMTMNSNTVTYAGAKIFAGHLNYAGPGRIVVSSGAWLQACSRSPSAPECVMEIHGVLGQQDGMVISPVGSLVFAADGEFFMQTDAHGTVVVNSRYVPNDKVKEGSKTAHPFVHLGSAEHLETTLDLSRWTDTFDDSAEGSLTFQAGSTVTVDIGERTQGLGKPAFLWKDAPDETVKFKPSDAMKRRGVFVVSREDGVYFKTGFTVIIR